MPRKERDTSKKRKELIDAAVATFEDVGYDAATMEQIATNAGAAKKTLYNHFETKEKLLEVIIRKCISNKDEITNLCYSSDRPLKIQLIELIELRIKNFIDPEAVKSMRVLFKTHTMHKDLFNRMYSGIDMHDENILIKWITEAEKDKRIIVADKEMASYIFWSMIYGAFIWPITMNNTLQPEEISKITHEIADMFLCRYEVK
jgi:TetR/AcrR family transcriptional regulator of autoinduction and epiphytic fitness